MFERYTDRARRVLFFSRYEASQLGSITIDTEHLLLGLLRESKGIAARLLADAGISADELARDLRSRSRFVEKVSTSVEMPFSVSAKEALERTAQEADRLSHSYIGMEHLLLGLARGTGSIAGDALRARGFDVDRAREVLAKLPEQHPNFGARAPGTAAHGIEPAEGVMSILDFLTHLRQTIADKETLQLVDRISQDLEDLKRRLG